MTELTRLIKLADITPEQPFITTIEATQAECAALAKRFELHSIQKLVIELRLYARHGQPLLDLVGQIKADLMPFCRVSNQHFPTVLNDKFKETLTTSQKLADELEAQDGPEEAPELIEGDMFDYGEVAAQWFGLCLDPYPRKPGAKIPEMYQGVEEEADDTAQKTKTTQANPFVALADSLKNVLNNGEKA
jgi:hypothetical protein